MKGKTTTLWKRLESRRCLILCCIIVLFMLLSSALPSGSAESSLVQLFFFLIMLFSPYFVSGGKRFFQLTLLAGAILLLPKSYVLFVGMPDETLRAVPLNISFEVVSTLFEVILMVCVVHYSLTSANDREPFSACVLTYLLLGIVFGNLYTLIYAHYPAAFAGTGQPRLTPDDLRYFSFITLSTCGYGDIVPRLAPVRALAALETVCGVMYVAVFIGRILRGRQKDGAA